MRAPNAGAGRADLRTMVIAACRELTSRGLTHGTSGNVSVRCDERRFLVSPSGIDYEVLEADDVALMDLDGRWFGRRRPSSEWRFHRDIFNSRRDIGAIVENRCDARVGKPLRRDRQSMRSSCGATGSEG